MIHRPTYWPLAVGALLAGLWTRDPIATAFAVVIVLCARDFVAHLERLNLVDEKKGS